VVFVLSKISFAAKIPNEPGALHRVAEVITRHNGNISRIHYDNQIDPQMVFFEVSCDENDFEKMHEELREMGYLRSTLPEFSFLKLNVQLPHRPGALHEFLNFTTKAAANIMSIDFNERGSHPDRVTVSLSLEETGVVDELLHDLKSRYPLEVTEYDTTGDYLDDTVFYVRFAHKIRPFLEEDESFLFSFLNEINHTVQELSNVGRDPKEVFDRVYDIGVTLNTTRGSGFYADVQEFEITQDLTMYCFQLPGGGNIFLFDAPEGIFMADTGYGIYQSDAARMFRAYGLDLPARLNMILTTHGDADHCGAGGFYNVPVIMHPGTLEIIRCENRAYGSKSEDWMPEKLYTTMIALFSHWNPPKEENIRLLPPSTGEMRGIFPVLSRISVGGVWFEILESPGGHQYGQLFLFAPDTGLLFTADSLINFASLTDERRNYNSIADFLITSVNVDSELARKERKALLALVEDWEAETGRKCLICCGHGAVSVIRDGRLEAEGNVVRYRHEESTENK